MQVKDLIREKDYDYISYRLKMQESKVDFLGKSIFVGCAKSENGSLIPLDNDTIYDEEDEVMEYEEWSKPEDGINEGLTVVVEFAGF